MGTARMKRGSLSFFVTSAVLTAACSSSSSSGGGDGGVGPTYRDSGFDLGTSPGGARATIYASPEQSNPCKGAVFAIGTFEPYLASNKDVSCSVKASSGGFTVSGQASASGGASFAVRGEFDASASTQIDITFTDAKGNHFERSCGFAYAEGAGSTPIADGRVWADALCGAHGEDVCSYEIGFRFENCDQ